MNKIKNVFIAGHNGMVGSAISRALASRDDVKLITASRSELDLLNQFSVKEFLADNDIDEVYLAAAKVGGIMANNTYPADFIFKNLTIQCNIINSSFESGIEKLLFLGSSCIYPRYADQPIQEDYLLSGGLEPTNEPYAIAKIAGIKLCESYNRQYGMDYRSVMPTNLYGPNDNFHPTESHVVPGLMRRFHEAKVNNLREVIVWGSGSPRREFLHVDDMALASIFVMELSKREYDLNTQVTISHVNVGSGEECSIRQLVRLVAETVGFKGKVTFDESKPDGAPRKLLNVERLSTMGWRYSINLKDGLSETYKWFLQNQGNFRT
jgi:GDP-L-fucose synthase